MTQQEQGMLDGLIGRVQGTQLAGKDNEAEQRIQQALGRNPDALYILCQTVLVQAYALDQATQQLNAAKQQLAQAQQGGGNTHPGFLEKIFGSSRADAPAPPQNYGGAPAPQSTYGGPVYTAPGYPPQGYPPQPPAYGGAYGQTGGFGGGGGFLQGALQTAAGVAMGEIAVQSIEGLVHGLGREAGYGSDRALGGFGGDRDFAGDAGTGANLGSGDSYGDRLANADGGGSGLSADIDDRRADGQGFFGGGADNNSGSNFADDSDTDSGSGDSSSYDDGGSDFSGDDGNSGDSNS